MLCVIEEINTIQGTYRLVCVSEGPEKGKTFCFGIKDFDEKQEPLFILPVQEEQVYEKEGTRGVRKPTPKERRFAIPNRSTIC